MAKSTNAIGPRVRAARATTADVRTSGHLDLQASSHTSGAFATLAKRRDVAAVLRICFAGKKESTRCAHASGRGKPSFV